MLLHSCRAYLRYTLGSFTLLIILSSRSEALTVSDIKATHRNGQTFITWTCPKGTNLQYKIYRSTSKLNSSSDLSSANYLGFVQDSSTKNIRRESLEHQKIFFKIKDNGS